MFGVSTPPSSLLNDRSLQTHIIFSQFIIASCARTKSQSWESGATYRDCRSVSWPMSAARTPLMPMVDSFLKELSGQSLSRLSLCVRNESFTLEFWVHLHGDHFVIGARHSLPWRIAAGVVGLSPGRRRVLPLNHQRPEHGGCRQTPWLISSLTRGNRIPITVA
jgi:hypothetical protein